MIELIETELTKSIKLNGSYTQERILEVQFFLDLNILNAYHLIERDENLYIIHTGGATKLEDDMWYHTYKSGDAVDSKNKKLWVELFDPKSVEENLVTFNSLPSDELYTMDKIENPLKKGNSDFFESKKNLFANMFTRSYVPYSLHKMFGKKLCQNFQLNDDNTVTFMCDERSTTSKVGRIFKNIFTKDFFTKENQSRIELFVNDAQSHNKIGTIKVVQGDDLIHYGYNRENYHSNSGELGNSCMADMDDSVFEIYTENPNVVSLVVLVNEEDKTLGRALIWETDQGFKYLDRVYSSDNKYRDYIIKYAHKNLDATHFFNEGASDIIEGYSKFNGTITVSLDTEWGSYPYMDTFRYGTDGEIQSTDDVCDYTYDCTNGERNSDKITTIDGDREDEDDCCYLDYENDNGDWIEGWILVDDVVSTPSGSRREEDTFYDEHSCESICNTEGTYCEIECETVETDNVSYCETLDVYAHHDNMCYSESLSMDIHNSISVYSTLLEDNFVKDDSVYSDYHESYIPSDDATKQGDDYIHDDYLDTYLEENEPIEEKEEA